MTKKTFNLFQYLGLFISMIGIFLDTHYNAKLGITLIVIGVLTTFISLLLFKKQGNRA